jgi:organic radical activating enzyme
MLQLTGLLAIRIYPMQEDKIEEVPFLSNIGLMLTYKCTIACPHCIVKAGPDRKEEMTLESAIKWLDQMRAFRDGFVCGVSLTGGEPFYNLQLMLNIADYAHKLGFIVSVVSNAYWASSKEEALRILKLCSSIQMISVSTDIPHQKSIPFVYVKNAIWAAKKTGKLYNIAVATENEESPDFLNLMDNLLEITDKEYINTAIILPVGRAEKAEINANYNLSSEPPNAACTMASFPVIFPNGNIIACIGPPITLPEHNPLFLGNLHLENITEIFERAESNFILHTIRTFGPKALVDLIKENGYESLLPDNYIDEAICDICFKLFSNKTICDLLEELIKNDEKFRLKTAFGRQYYLNESEMVVNVEPNSMLPAK